jgi:hypothetical protein
MHFCSRELLSHHESHQPQLKFIAEGIKLLLKRESLKTVTTLSQDKSEPEKHLVVLRGEIKKTASTISDPVVRYSFEESMNSALSQISTAIITFQPEELKPWSSMELTRYKALNQPSSPIYSRGSFERDLFVLSGQSMCHL